MKSVFIFTCLTCAVVINALPANYNQGASVSQPKPGAAIDEVIVESSLYIKNKKNQGRRTRDTQDVALNNPSPLVLRLKRAPRRRPQNDQSTANAAANSNYFGPEGFGAGAANAQAQGFNSDNFGANAANTQTQSFHVGPNGLQGTAGLSATQVYHLPNGKTVNVAFANGFSTGPDGAAQSNANGVTVT